MAHSGSKGSHYALTAIGLGMLVLGIIMAVWNLVPGFGLSEKLHSVGNSSKADTGGGTVYKSKTFSVAYVLVASGTLLLLFSICLTIRDKRAQNRNEALSRIQREPSVQHQQQEDSQEEDEETLSRYYVPSYEEVMNTEYGQQREPEENARISMSLPSYESLTGIDENTPTRPMAVSEAKPDLEHQFSQHGPRLSKRRKPLKIRRIKSEKLHLKSLQINVPGENNSGHITIEPLTPPPKYDEVPKKATDIQGDTADSQAKTLSKDP